MRRSANLEVFKEPRGFIKILQVGIAIFAFATTAGYYSEFKVKSVANVNITCPGTSTTVVIKDQLVYEVLAKFEYSFDDLSLYISQYKPHCNLNDSNIQHTGLKGKFKSESQFFVFTGVATFLYCLIASLYYVLYEDQEQSMYSTDIGRCSFVVIDFVFSVVLAIFWFTSSAAWASGLPDLKDDTDPDLYKRISPYCDHDHYTCEVTKEPNYATLRVSVILGFLNVFVWLGNLWFLFKETPWHNPRREHLISDTSVQ